MRKLSLMEVIILLALMLSAPAFGAELVSANNQGTDGGTDPSTLAAMSGDGRRIVFLSRSTDLVGIGLPGTLNVFVRDLLLRTNRLVSINRFNSAAGNGDSRDGVMSRDGRWVAFVSSANDLVSNDSNLRDDVFVRDLDRGRTVLVSLRWDDLTGGNGPSGSPSISADGRFVAFVSSANDLIFGIPSDGNKATDVFVRDLQLNRTSLVSVNRLGSATGSGASSHAVMSQNGSNVVFTSQANDLTFTPDGNNATDVFVRDLNANNTTLVSVNRLGTAAANGASDSGVPNFTADAIVFLSSASDIIFNDGNHAVDVFVRKGIQTTAITLNRLGTSTANGPSGAATIDDAGATVAFHSDADDLVFDDGNKSSDVFVRKLSLPSNMLVSGNFSDDHPALGASTNPRLSADGTRIAFQSTANNLTVNDNNGFTDVFVRSMAGNNAELVSISRTLTASGNGPSYLGLISTNGAVIAFESSATDLTFPTPVVVPQVYASCGRAGLCSTPPTLQIVIQGTSVMISWTAVLPGFRLESSPSSAGPWSPVTVVPTVVGDRNTVTISGGGATQFYRLVAQ